MTKEQFKKLANNRAVIFTAGAVVGPIVIYTVFNQRIGVILRADTVHLLAHKKALALMAETGLSLDFITPSGIFKLMPPA